MVFSRVCKKNYNNKKNVNRDNSNSEDSCFEIKLTKVVSTAQKKEKIY